MKLGNLSSIIAFDPFSSNTTSEHNMGEEVRIGDGRAFRYYQTAATHSAGKLKIAPTPKTNHYNMAVTASAIGTTIVNVTPGATAVVASEYNEGYLAINASTGAGQLFKVSNTPAMASSTAGNVTLFDPIVVALTATSKATLFHNTYFNSVEGTTATLRSGGVCLVAITGTSTAPNYGWLQTHGESCVLNDGTITLGSDIIVGTVAGSVAAASGTYGTALLTPRIGSASFIAGVDTEYRPMWLQIN